MTELELHRSVAKYLPLALPNGAWWTSIAHGGGGKRATPNAPGMKLGVPDVCIVWQGRAYWIELKSEKGRMSPEQVDTHLGIEIAGSKVSVCRSLAQVEVALRMMGVPIRAKVAA